MSILTRLQKLEQATNERIDYIIIRQPGESPAQALERVCVKPGDSVIYIDIYGDEPFCLKDSH